MLEILSAYLPQLLQFFGVVGVTTAVVGWVWINMMYGDDDDF